MPELKKAIEECKELFKKAHDDVEIALAILEKGIDVLTDIELEVNNAGTSEQSNS